MELRLKRCAALALLSVSLASVLAHAAGTAQVKGKVVGHTKLTSEVYAEAAKPESHRYSWREYSPTVRAEFRQLSPLLSREVCLAISSSQNVPAGEPRTVRVTGGRTVPQMLVVAPGTRLIFKNVDPFPHRLYLVGDTKWPPGVTNPNATRDFVVQAPGKLEFRDELFPSVRTLVVVDPQAIEFVHPDLSGAFVFPSLSAGEYAIKAYFAGKQVGSTVSVRVKDKETVELKEPITLSEGK